MKNCCIVIPCYNEEKRLLLNEFLTFIDENPNIRILFVNDGSIDNTKEILEKLKEGSPRIDYISLAQNQGKSEAIRSGVLEVLKNTKIQYIAYLDADLAIPLDEFNRLLKLTIENSNLHFTYFSKIQKKNSKVKQPFKRFVIGRILAFMNRISLRLSIYDTQCGCKLMTREIGTFVFSKPFISAWLFDVEIFWRILNHYGKNYFDKHTLEVPLNKLIERGPSSISGKALFKLPFEYLKIHRKYKK
jgi:dolichyl-phosphate beta-glucosyltransferase